MLKSLTELVRETGHLNVWQEMFKFLMYIKNAIT